MAGEIKPSAVEKELAEIAKTNIESFDVKGGEGTSEKLVDAIEMIGECPTGELLGWFPQEASTSSDLDRSLTRSASSQGDGGVLPQYLVVRSSFRLLCSIFRLSALAFEALTSSLVYSSHSHAPPIPRTLRFQILRGQNHS